MAEVSVKLRISVKTPATITSPVSWFRIDMLVGVELFTLHVSPNGDDSFISCLWYAWNTVMLGISEMKFWQICINIKITHKKKRFFFCLQLWNICISSVNIYNELIHINLIKCLGALNWSYSVTLTLHPTSSFFNCMINTKTLI